MRTETLLALAINRLSPLKSAEKTLLAEVVDTDQFYLSLDERTLGQIIGRPLRGPGITPSDTLKAAERDLAYCIQRTIAIVPFWDSRYPVALREIFDPPFLLFVRGRLPDPETPNLAIVGTRQPTAASVVAAERTARGIAEAGHTVISGLARGIDAAAHRGALISTSPDTVATGAVLGCGIDRVYPAGNRLLAERILSAGGFILSEYSPGVGPAKYHFPARNRIISGMSRGVVVIQAPAKSGALITADYALDQGRDLFVHADGIAGAEGAGTRELAEDGARIVSGHLDIFDEWGADTTGMGVSEASSVLEPEAPGGCEAGMQLAQMVRQTLISGRADE